MLDACQVLRRGYGCSYLTSRGDGRVPSLLPPGSLSTARRPQAVPSVHHRVRWGARGKRFPLLNHATLYLLLQLLERRRGWL
jgi:hypothetical protein